MPRKSARSKALDTAIESFHGASALFIITQLIENAADTSEVFRLDLDDSNPGTVSFLAAFARLQKIRSFRYFLSRNSRRAALKSFEEDLCVEEDGRHWLSDAEFKRKYRCTRETLDKITAAIENSPVFKQGTRGTKQIPVKQQLMISLHQTYKQFVHNTLCE